MKLRGFGLGDQVREINLAGAQLARARWSGRRARRMSRARSAARRPRRAWGKTGVDMRGGDVPRSAQALGTARSISSSSGVSRPNGSARPSRRSAASCRLPIVAQMTTEEDGSSLDGAPPEQFAPELIKRGASVVGVNCSVGPAPMLETVERISDIVDVWLSAQPNAGKPRDIEGRNLYLCSPEYMASYARRFIASGVRLVGCAGRRRNISGRSRWRRNRWGRGWRVMRRKRTRRVSLP